jgi:hypothetical protein
MPVLTSPPKRSNGRIERIQFQNWLLLSLISLMPTRTEPLNTSMTRQMRSIDGDMFLFCLSFQLKHAAVRALCGSMCGSRAVFGSVPGRSAPARLIRGSAGRARCWTSKVRVHFTLNGTSSPSRYADGTQTARDARPAAAPRARRTHVVPSPTYEKADNAAVLSLTCRRPRPTPPRDRFNR